MSDLFGNHIVGFPMGRLLCILDAYHHDINLTTSHNTDVWHKVGMGV